MFKPNCGLNCCPSTNQDAYNDPGSPLTRRAANGEYVLATLDGGSKLVLMGSGHRPEGKQPFVDVLDICSGATQRIWESQPPYLEHPIALMETPHDGDPPTYRRLRSR